MTKYIYGYFEDKDDLSLSTIKNWEKKFTYSSAQKYLRNHLLKSLEDDFPVALEVFKKRNIGFFALPRIIFPYITFLGTLYKGEDKSRHALEFMSDYMGRVAPEYKFLTGIYYVGYRHGLMHTNMPKIFAFGKRKFGWRISYAKATTNNRTDFLNNSLLLYPELFFEDLRKAINHYINDFSNPKKKLRLFNNFKKGFIEMAKIHYIKDIPGKNNQRFLRRSLKNF